MAVAQWAKDFTEEVFGPAPFKVGDVVTHPSGRSVRIVHGCYWGEWGLSNHWGWREIMADGSLGPVEYGYGWRQSSGVRRWVALTRTWVNEMSGIASDWFKWRRKGK